MHHRQSHQAKSRSIRLTTGSPENLGEHFTFCIAVQGKEDFYDAVELPTDYGRGFQVAKETGEQAYDVNLDGRRSTCECPGFAFRGTCRHLQGLHALIRQGILPPVGSAPILTELDREFGPVPPQVAARPYCAARYCPAGAAALTAAMPIVPPQAP